MDTDARAGLLRWVKETVDAHIIYRFYGPAPAADPAAFSPAWLPDGYAEAERYSLQGDSLTLSVYKHPNGGIITFSCGVMQQGSATAVLPEGAVEEEVTVSGLPGVFYVDLEGNDENLLVWIDETQNLHFSLQSYADKSVMLHIAESVFWEE